MPQITIPYIPRKHQLEVHNCKARYITLVAHRRFGKSVFALNHIVRAAIQKKGRYAIVCPLYDQARSIYWISGLVEKFVPEQAVLKAYENSMIIYFKNGSTLEFSGSDNPKKYNKFRGAQFNGLVMDEFSDHDYTGWKAVFRYCIAAQSDGGFDGGWVIFTGTVKGENHLWQEYLREGKNRASFLFRASETGILSEQDIEEIREECDGDESIMMQELECIPMYYSGLIYKEFGDHNFVKPFQIPADWGWGYAQDHGANNPTVFGVYRIDYEGNVFRVGEYYRPNATIYDHAPVIRELRKTDDPIIADPSMFNNNMQKQQVTKNKVENIVFSVVDEYKELGVDGYIKANNDVQAGIARMKKYLRIDPEHIHPLTGQKGSPRFFVVEGSSPAFEKEIRNYRWKEKKDGLNDPDVPVKLDDHAMDECRYFLMSRPEHERQEIKKHPTRAEIMRAKLERKEQDLEDDMFMDTFVSWDQD